MRLGLSIVVLVGACSRAAPSGSPLVDAERIERRAAIGAIADGRALSEAQLDHLLGADPSSPDAPALRRALDASVARVAIAPAARAEPAVEQAIRAVLGDVDRVRAVHVVAPDWQRVTLDDGTPAYRLTVAQAIVQARGASFCRLHTLEARQPAADAAHWSPAIAVVAVGGVRIARCPDDRPTLAASVP